MLPFSAYVSTFYIIAKRGIFLIRAIIMFALSTAHVILHLINVGHMSPGLERAATVIYLINKSVVHEVLHFTAYLFFISSSVAADELVVSRINKYLPTAQSLT